MIEFLYLFIGLVLLLKGSEHFVKSASSIAKGFGVSEFTIGLTLVAIGTSLPELVSSLIASARHESGLVIGTLFGANIANICLIVGIAACVTAIKTNKEMLRRDGYILVGVFALIFFVVFDGIVRRWEGGLLFLLFVAYTLFLFEKTPRNVFGFTAFVQYFLTFSYVRSLLKAQIPERSTKRSVVKDLAIIAGSGFLVVLGAHILVQNALGLATTFGLPSVVLGVLIAIGTTMPEMMVALTAARQGLGNLVIGNAIGSCITNSLLIAGVSSLVNPLVVSSLSIFFVVPFMFGSGMLLLLFIWSYWKIRRIEGVTFVAVYALFLFLMYRLV